MGGLDLPLLLPLRALAGPGSDRVAGILVRLFSPDPAALVLPGLRAPLTTLVASPRLRLVLAVCVRLEDMETVLPPLERLLTTLRAAVDSEHVVLGILSDMPSGPQARAEAASVAAVSSRYPDGVVLYRRRDRNDGFKAGNVMDFLDRYAERFDVMLPLDAHSSMSPSAVGRMLAMIAADPKLAILQLTIGNVDARTFLACAGGVGTRHGAQIWATGQAWWQEPCGPFWGHNALIRIAPFRAPRRLNPLPDETASLSHDHVEAARLHAAGWAVRVGLTTSVRLSATRRI